MKILKHDWLVRIAVGGLCGLALQTLLATLLASLSFWGPSTFRFAFFFNNTNLRPGWLWDLLTTALMFAFGAEVGMSTLPFADGGGELLKKSLLHFAVMAATVTAWAWLNFGWRELHFFLIPLVLVYALVWLGRWVGWYAEVAQIREGLGIAPKPSPLKWRETLPHMAFATLLCGVVPLALRALDPVDSPVLSAALTPFLMVVGGFVTGISLGKRQGFSPLYPLVCGVCALPVMAVALIPAWVYPVCALVPAFFGNLLGAATRARRTWGVRAL